MTNTSVEVTDVSDATRYEATVLVDRAMLAELRGD